MVSQRLIRAAVMVLVGVAALGFSAATRAGLSAQQPAPASRIAVDPDDGTIVRLTLVADLDQGDLATLLEEAGEGRPLSRADLMVEYSPVEIGGKSYFCPTRSVAISRARTLLTSKDGKAPHLGPEKIFVNDVSFTQYHVFRSESRILTGSQ